MIPTSFRGDNKDMENLKDLTMDDATYFCDRVSHQSPKG